MLTITFLSLFAFSSAHANLTLEGAYQAALVRSEDVANQMELVTQAEEKYSQAVGAVLPNVNFVGTYLRQDAGATIGSISPQDQKTYKISAIQPLFKGFREYAALRQQSILTHVAKFNRDAASIQLFQDTALAFYQVLMSEKDLKNLETEIGVNEKRLKDIQGFRRIGRSRESEVLTIETNIASLEAQLENAKTVLPNARAAFNFLTGTSNEVLLDDYAIPTKIEPIEKYLNRIPTRPDVLSAKETEHAADEGVSIAKGGHLPSLDLGGNYYLARPGFLSNVKWDVSLTLTFSIFQGGIINSGVAIASSQRKQADLALSKSERQAKEQIEVAHGQLNGDYTQIQKLKRAVELSEKNYQAEMRDYRLGLVNNLEALQALTSAQESQRQYDRLQYQLKNDYMRLQAVANILPKPGVKELIE